MKANDYISKKEHTFLTVFVFTAFVFVLSVFTSEEIRIHNLSISPFSSSNYANAMPGLHFLTFFIFVALLKTKRFLLSSLLTIFYAVVFIYGLSIRYNASRLGGEEFSPKFDFLDQVYRAANGFDYLAALFISILLFWQISILLRILMKTTQRKIELP